MPSGEMESHRIRYGNIGEHGPYDTHYFLLYLRIWKRFNPDRVISLHRETGIRMVSRGDIGYNLL